MNNNFWRVVLVDLEDDHIVIINSPRAYRIGEILGSYRVANCF